jgi:hypothetical protein
VTRRRRRSFPCVVATCSTEARSPCLMTFEPLCSV